MQIGDFDYVEFYVGNARQAAHFYRTAFGFDLTAYAGPETGVRDRTTFVVSQGKIRLLLTSAVDPYSAIAEHVKLHGDGVKDIAFKVSDAGAAFEESVKHGAQQVLEPTVFEDESGRTVKATIATFGDTVHSFVQRDGDGLESTLPGYRPLTDQARKSTALGSIDHIAVAIEHGKLEGWVDFYDEVLGFHQSHQENILTEYSGMNSRVVQNSNGCIKFPIMEPIRGTHKSQIEEYLSSYYGPGAQHVALMTDDIVATVRELRLNGIEFLQTPATYYEMLKDRVGEIDIDPEALKELGVLVDCDRHGYLLQIFSKPLQSRPTIFFEIIQRMGAQGFGGGNIKALFQAVEREQALRGNL